MYISIIPRPCQSLLSVTVFGPHPCGNLTFRRRRDGVLFFPQCSDCSHRWEEKPLSGSEVAPKFDVELGIYQSLMDIWFNPDMETYREYEIDNTCGFGCTIYINETTGRKVLAHNSAYGCKRI
jgi:hypothetical protein